MDLGEVVKKSVNDYTLRFLRLCVKYFNSLF
jgi:hypothetical protein